MRTWLSQSVRPAAQTQCQCIAACVWGARAPRPQVPPQVRVGQKREHVDVFMMKDADHSESVRCFMFLLQSRVFRDRTRGSIYQVSACSSIWPNNNSCSRRPHCHDVSSPSVLTCWRRIRRAHCAGGVAKWSKQSCGARYALPVPTVYRVTDLLEACMEACCRFAHKAAEPWHVF